MVLLGVAVIQDIRTNKVRNNWIAVLFIATTILRFGQEGLRGVGLGLAQMMIVLLILLPVFAFRILGAADIKIFLALSVLFPLQDMMFIFVLSLILGAFLGIISVLIPMYKMRSYSISDDHIPFLSKTFHYIHFTIPIFISVLLHVYGGIYELFIRNL